METVRQLPEITGYEFGREIESGWATAVWEARANDSGEPRAIKLVDIGALGNPGIANALKRESGMVATLSQDNVIRIHETGVTGHHFYLVMEWLDGGDLQSRITGGMEWQDALSVARSVADALGHAHEHGVIHRDIRPSNVLFDRDGGPVLSNFGISRIIERNSGATRPLSSTSLPHYAAPEQIQGRGATPKSDIYSLGVLTYAMLVGKPPFDGGTVNEVRTAHLQAELPPMPPGCDEVEPLVRRMLAKDPGDRPADAGQVADELERIVDSGGGATVPRGGTRTRLDQPTGGSTAVRSGDSTTAAPRTQIMQGDPDDGGGKPQTERSPKEVQTFGVGTLVRDRFQIEGVLGEGGMGSVYYALDLLKQEAGDDNPYVALKVMHPQIASAELTFMALQREAKRAQDLAHPNIVTVYDLDRVEGIVYMTMELLQGKDSEQHVIERQRILKKTEVLEPEEARSIVNDVSAGLAYAHTRGITHADLKPQNVFLADDGRAKLLDFGIARAHRANKPDAIEEIFSGYTPAYASPEILGGEKAMPADDVYALGCIAYYYFTGRHPFDNLPATEAQDRGLKPKRPRNMRRTEWKAVSSALDFRREKRPQDAEEFIKRFSPSRVKRVAVAFSVVSVVIAIGLGWMLGDRAGPEIPFDELPLSTQARINQDLEDAGLFLESGDINAALQLYDGVLKAHPGNRRGTAGMEESVETVLATVKENVRNGDMRREDATATLDTLLTYERISESLRNDIKSARSSL